MRLLQEKKLRMTSKGKKTLNDIQIKNFIMYYERLTKHMLKNLKENLILLLILTKASIEKYEN